MESAAANPQAMSSGRIRFFIQLLCVATAGQPPHPPKVLCQIPPSSGTEKTFNFVMLSSLESCNLLRDVN